MVICGIIFSVVEKFNRLYAGKTGKNGEMEKNSITLHKSFSVSQREQGGKKLEKVPL
ncbi:hypothetical protein QFZ72_000961 [Bacillus sp. V2I10]|nr:hypothetical protein [Bacillus sp. V2I10]